MHMLLLHRAVFVAGCFLRLVTLAFSTTYLIFVFVILPDQLQEKPSYGKIISLPSAHWETQWFLDIRA